MRGRTPCAPDKPVDKILRIGARASCALKEACEHERGNAALQHDLPAPYSATTTTPTGRYENLALDKQ